MHLRHFHSLSKSCSFIGINKYAKSYSIQAAAALKDGDISASIPERTDSEWVNAKPFSEIPTPSKLFLIRSRLPGGKFYKLPITEIQRELYKMHGPAVYIRGVFGQMSMLFSFDANDFEKVLRNEGAWPIRPGLETFTYYRKHVRPDVYSGNGGLMTEQNKEWADLRSLVNPILMKPQNMLYYLPQIDQIVRQFIERIQGMRDSKTFETPSNFEEEANRWSLESIAAVALNTRLGLVGKIGDNKQGEKLVQGIKDFFQLAYELDMVPSIWKYYKTPKFVKLMKAYDAMTDVSLHFINEAEQRYLERKSKNIQSDEDRSILTQLIEKDRHSAIITAIDLLLAGVDTTSATVISTLYKLASNPEKQEILKNEIEKILPEKESILTEENIRNLPYLRACIKESLRVAGLVNGTIRTTVQDLVLSGYQIPKGTNIFLLGKFTSMDEKNFPRPNEFIPERWLRNDTEQKCPVEKLNNPFAYLPFGFGARMCVGKRLAHLEIETLLIRIIRNFQVEWHHKELQYRNNLINTPCGEIKFKFIDRP